MRRRITRPARSRVSRPTRSRSSSSRMRGTSASSAAASTRSWSAAAGRRQGASRASISRREPRTWSPAKVAAAASTDVPGRASTFPSGGQQRASGQQYDQYLPSEMHSASRTGTSRDPHAVRRSWANGRSFSMT